MADNRESLLVIDMLNDFREGDAPFSIPGFTDIIEPIKREIEKARKNSFPVIYICDYAGYHDLRDR